jgi:hypothetical protein
LGVDHAEHGVRVGLAIDVGDAPVVADDGDLLRLSFQPSRIGLGGRTGGARGAQGSKGDEEPTGVTRHFKILLKELGVLQNVERAGLSLHYE